MVQTAATGQLGAPARRGRWAGLTAVLIAEAMNLLDATVVQVAGPRIHADLGGSLSDIQWYSAAYTLAFAAALITGGRLGDIAGRKRAFQVGLAGFTLMSAACAVAPSPALLITFRFAQGAAAAAVIPQTMGLIRTMYSGDELGKALSNIGPVMGVTGLAGPVIGGLIVHADLLGSSWRGVFLVNVPIAVAVLAMSRKLPDSHAPRRPRLDLTGTLLVVAGSGLVIYPLIGAGSGRLTARALALIGAGIIVLAGFCVYQRYLARAGREPLVEPSLFASRQFPAALVTSTLYFAVVTGLTLAISLQLQLGLGATALTAGLTLVPLSAASAIGSLASGRYLLRRLGTRRMFAAGLSIQMAGLGAAIAVYHGTAPPAYPWPLLIALGLAGAGGGLFTTPFFTAALHQVSPQETGSAAGLLNAVQQFGGTLGLAILGSVYLLGAGTTAASSLAAIQHALWTAIALLAGTAVAAAVMTSRPRPASGVRQHGGPGQMEQPAGGAGQAPGSARTER
jgi:EmrB/QacA subfamily drug resistance transporter